jgi:hypothetical protein
LSFCPCCIAKLVTVTLNSVWVPAEKELAEELYPLPASFDFSAEHLPPELLGTLERVKVG